MVSVKVSVTCAWARTVALSRCFLSLPVLLFDTPFQTLLVYQTGRLRTTLSAMVVTATADGTAATSSREQTPPLLR